MSDKSRLQKNNQDLDNIKTEINNLPDYQNIEPIYAQSGGINLNNKTLFGIQNYGSILNVDQKGKYIVIGCSSSFHIFKYENNNLTKLYTQTSSKGGTCYILGYNDNNIFVTYSLGEGDYGYDKWRVGYYSLDTNTFTYKQYLASNYRGTRLHTINNGFMDLSGVYNSDTIQYLYKIPETGTDIEFYTYSTGTYGGTYHPELTFANNLLFYFSYGNIYFKLNVVNYDTKSITKKTLNIAVNSTLVNNIIGINKTLTKFFCKDGIYTVNDDFTIGTKLNDLVINGTSNVPEFDSTYNSSYYRNLIGNICNSDFYISLGKIGDKTQYLLEFNESTNEFTSIAEYNNQFIDFYNKHISSYSTIFNNENFYVFNGSTQEIGFKRNGEIFYYGLGKPTIDNAKLLIGNSTNDRYGNLIVGTMPNNGALNITPSTTNQTIPVGYTSGGTVSGDSNLVQANIRSGVTIFGVEGNLEPDKPDQTKTVTPSTSQQTIEPDVGYELASVTVEAVTNSIDSNIQAGNIKSGVEILGVTGTYEGSGGGGSGDTEYNIHCGPNAPSAVKGLWFKTQENINVEKIVMDRQANLVSDLTGQETSRSTISTPGIRVFTVDGTDYNWTINSNMKATDNYTFYFGCGSDGKTVIREATDGTLTKITSTPYDVRGAICYYLSSWDTVFIFGGTGSPNGVISYSIRNLQEDGYFYETTYNCSLSFNITDSVGFCSSGTYYVDEYMGGGGGNPDFNNGDEYILIIGTNGAAYYLYDDQRNASSGGYHSTYYNYLRSLKLDVSSSASLPNMNNYKPLYYTSEPSAYSVTGTKLGYYVDTVNRKIVCMYIDDQLSSDYYYSYESPTYNISFYDIDYNFPAEYSSGTWLYGYFNNTYKYIIFGTDTNPLDLIYPSESGSTWTERRGTGVLTQGIHGSSVKVNSSAGVSINLTFTGTNDIINYHIGGDKQYDNNTVVLVKPTDTYNYRNHQINLLSNQGDLDGDLEVCVYDAFLYTTEGGLNRSVEIVSAGIGASAWATWTHSI